MNSMWFLCTDAYSKYPFVVKMSNITAVSTIRALQAIFSSEGLPDMIVSDNGTSFTSKKFQEFCKENGIQHFTIAPFHPSSNGEAERCVRTFKTSLKKSILDGDSTDFALLKYLSTYRFSPGITGKSPAELIHGRQPKTILSLMFPKESKTTDPVPDFNHKFAEGEAVYARNYARGKRWLNGEIINTLGKMMYLVRTDNGNLRRHQNQIRTRSLLCPYQQADALKIPVKASMIDFKFNDFSRSSIFKNSKSSKFEVTKLLGHLTNEQLSPSWSGELPRRSERTRNPAVRFNCNPSQE